MKPQENFAIKIKSFAEAQSLQKLFDKHYPHVKTNFVKFNAISDSFYYVDKKGDTHYVHHAHAHGTYRFDKPGYTLFTINEFEELLNKQPATLNETYNIF